MRYKIYNTLFASLRKFINNAEFKFGYTANSIINVFLRCGVHIFRRSLNCYSASESTTCFRHCSVCNGLHSLNFRSLSIGTQIDVYFFVDYFNINAVDLNTFKNVNLCASSNTVKFCFVFFRQETIFFRCRKNEFTFDIRAACFKCANFSCKFVCARSLTKLRKGFTCIDLIKTNTFGGILNDQ